MVDLLMVCQQNWCACDGPGWGFTPQLQGVDLGIRNIKDWCLLTSLQVQAIIFFFSIFVGGASNHTKYTNKPRDWKLVKCIVPQRHMQKQHEEASNTKRWKASKPPTNQLKLKRCALKLPINPKLCGASKPPNLKRMSAKSGSFPPIWRLKSKKTTFEGLKWRNDPKDSRPIYLGGSCSQWQKSWETRDQVKIGNPILQVPIFCGFKHFISFVVNTCWWFRNPEKKTVEVGMLVSHDFTGFLIHPNRWLGSWFLKHQRRMPLVAPKKVGLPNSITSIHARPQSIGAMFSIGRIGISNKTCQ